VTSRLVRLLARAAVPVAVVAATAGVLASTPVHPSPDRAAAAPATVARGEALLRR
jgi:hypothetical protein